ncbi:MAG: glycosyltransferase [Phycisphaerales bacterium]
MLASKLVEKGHDVVWWNSDFDHHRKRHRNRQDRSIQIQPNFEVRLLKSLGYKAHVGPRRLLNNVLMARRWRTQSRTETPPDLLFSAWPTPELSLEATKYAGTHGVPSVIDIRDLWPTLWLDLFPERLRPIGRILLHHYFRMTRTTMTDATAITGATDSYVDWGVGYSGRARRDSDRSFGFRFRSVDLDADSRAEARLVLDGMGYQPDERIQIVFAGAFSRSFELKTIIEAGRWLDANTAGRLRIVMCGSGDRWNQIEIAARDIDSVLVLPRLDLRELTFLYEQSSLGLAPYRDIENFQRNIPNKINEYLQMSLPIVAGVGGAIANLIDDHGVGVRYRSEDPISMAEELTKLALDPDRLQTFRMRASAYRDDHINQCDDIDRLATHLVGLAQAESTR